MSTDRATTLPPLPEPWISGIYVRAYTEDQMQAYAAEAVRLCAQIAKDDAAKWPHHGGGDAIAAAILALLPKEDR